MPGLGAMKAITTNLLQEAQRDRVRAVKCRDLIYLTSKPEAIAHLEQLAGELETRAEKLELHAHALAGNFAVTQRPADRGSRGQIRLEIDAPGEPPLHNGRPRLNS